LICKKGTFAFSKAAIDAESRHSKKERDSSPFIDVIISGSIALSI